MNVKGGTAVATEEAMLECLKVLLLKRHHTHICEK
jgi:hypothetical protein